MGQPVSTALPPAWRYGLPWKAALVAAAVGLALAVWIAAAYLLPFAVSANSTAEKFTALSASISVGEDAGSIPPLRADVDALYAELSAPAQSLRWLGRMSPAAFWVPGLHREVSSWGGLGARLRHDLDTATTLLDDTSRLMDTYDDAEAALAATENVAVPPTLPATADALHASFSQHLDTLGGSPFGVVPELPGLRNSMQDLEALESKMISASRIGLTASSLLQDLVAIAEGIRPLMDEVAADGSGSDDFTADSLKASLASLESQAQHAVSTTGDLSDLLSGFEGAGSLAGRITSLSAVLNALALTGQAGADTMDAIAPLLQAAESTQGGLLSGGSSLTSAFSEIEANRGRIESAITRLQQARARLAEARGLGNTSGIVRHLDALDTLTTRMEGGLHLLSGLSPVAAGLLGAEGERRYLVLGHSADELRATGGFVSAVWLVTFDPTGLADVEYIDTVRVDDWERLELYPKAPQGLEENMNAWVWLMRDVSWEPDFPTTAATAEDMFRLGQRREVDGVVAINQWSLLRLVEAIGDVPAPEGGDPITSRNLLPILEQGTDQFGRAYMDLVLQGVLNKLRQSTSLGTLVRLGSALYDSLEEREALVYLDDAESQAVMSRLGWDGSVRQDSGDYLYVVDSNVGWSKVDRSIQRDLSYEVDLRNPARPRATLALTYANHSGPGSPGCVPQWLSRGTDYSQLKNACYWDYLRTYLPLGTRLLSSDPLPLPEYSVAVEIGKGVPGEDTGRVWSDLGKTVFSGLVPIAAGERRTITLVYDLPSQVTTVDGESLRYRLLIQKQPGVRRRGVTVTLRLPDGYALASSSLPPTRVFGRRVSFVFEATHDMLFDMRLVREPDGTR